MSALSEVALPRVVLLTDARGVNVTDTAAACTSALRDEGREVHLMALSPGPDPLALRALRAVEATDGLLLLTAPGLLARLDPRGGTLADAGTALRYKGISTGVVLAADPTTPGTLHAVALHSEVLRHRELPLLGTLALSAGPQGLSWLLPEEWETMTA
ncbi:hypothetical protein [Janibacter hoylei]|uniref:hypothetical protein n=1 Tax=Janibacter hoylei TaxID=364298 RepID=UPI0021A64025|nr:hypothetical protein [Janibacter hoylei]MCT1618269.1 hypothetical protein [Janibacter hoylei]MCT2293708.1 hypothetical protein [Janibacter hoylei]